MTDFTSIFQEKDIKITPQRLIIASVIDNSKDHPDVEEIYIRASKIDKKISMATIYRTISILEEKRIVMKLDIGDGKSRYEMCNNETNHHHHLIDITTGEIIEFHDEELDKLENEIARRLGYKLINHRFEIYGVPIKSE